jgi:hypothetical protein
MEEQFGDEILNSIVKENRIAAVQAGDGPEYYPSLTCALLAQLILDYRKNRETILSGDFATGYLGKLREAIEPILTAFGIPVQWPNAPSPEPVVTEHPVSQVDRLAVFITKNFPGEPSTDDGAVDIAIRLLQTQKEQISLLQKPSDAASVSDATGSESGAIPAATAS